MAVVGRACQAFILLSFTLFSYSCGGLASSKPTGGWTTGFWFWGGSSTALVSLGRPVDTLYVQVGTISRSHDQFWSVYGSLPDKLPKASEYWFVFRYDIEGLPGTGLVPFVMRHLERLERDANQQGLKIAGVQFDIDCPTGKLAEYAGLLRETRKAMLPGRKLSITALLDWFRGGTAIADVLKEVDEFVPQFYDVWASTDYRGNRDRIAAPVDAARWGPVFNRFHKSYRIGISSFGRARRVSSADTSHSNAVSTLYQDISPLDVSSNPAFRPKVSTSPAREMVLGYSATRRTEIGWTQFDPGDGVEFVFPTLNSIRTAVKSAKAMGGYATGVVFFRWPAFSETLAASPDQVLRAAGVLPNSENNISSLQVLDRACAAVYCTDLYLTSTQPLSEEPIRHLFRSSSELEYFMPAERVPARMSGPSEIEMTIPPFCGRERIYVGRAVTEKKADFSLEVK